MVNFQAMPKIDPMAHPTHVRWNPAKRRYELVVDGVVQASISKLQLTIGFAARKFGEQVRAALEARVAR